MRAVLTRPRLAATRTPVAAAVVAVVASLAAFLLLRAPMSEPTHLAQLQVVNPHAWPVGIDLVDPVDGAHTPLGTIDPRRTTTFHDVLDQGATWTFAFRYAGVDGGTATLSRAVLEQQEWSFEVPLEVVLRFESGGKAPLG